MIPKGKVTGKEVYPASFPGQRSARVTRDTQSPLPSSSESVDRYCLTSVSMVSRRATTRSNSCKVRRGSSNKLHRAKLRSPSLKPGTHLRVIFSRCSTENIVEARDNRVLQRSTSWLTVYTREREAYIRKELRYSQAWSRLNPRSIEKVFATDWSVSPRRNLKRMLRSIYSSVDSWCSQVGISFLKRVQGFSHCKFRSFAISRQRG